MNFTINFPIPNLPIPITYPNAILLIGSCFTEHIGNRLDLVKFKTFQNPHGILFNPVSVCRCLKDITRNQIYTTDDLFYLNEAWHSWFHHSKFSGITAQESVDKINKSISNAYTFAIQADWLIITLGSAYAYRLIEKDMHVSNNHRAPSQWFEKELLDTNFIIENLKCDIENLKQKNKKLKILFTISPVRHLRDGLIQNNQSKARLIEAVHSICKQLHYAYYFPAYEIVIDELRDYRFFDIDFAHPNFIATEYVWQRFINSCINNNDLKQMDEIKQIAIAMQHKPFNITSQAHHTFLQKNLEKCMELQKENTWIDLQKEINYFKTNS